jgi:integrase
VSRARRKAQYGGGSVSRDGQLWRARWRQDGRRRSQSGFPSRELALVYLKGLTGDLARKRAGMEVTPRHGVKLIAALSKEYFDQRGGPKNRNNEDERRKFNNHLLPTLGRYRPNEVTPPMVLGLIAKLKTGGRLRPRKGSPRDGLSLATIKQLMAILSAFYSYLIVTEQATVNPWRKIPKDMRAKISQDYTEYWRTRPWVKKKSDIYRIHAAMQEPFRQAYAIGVSRGPRPGEVRALDWTEVDLAARLIHIVRQVREGKVGPPKGGKSRTLTISDQLHAELAAWHLKTGGRGLVIPAIKARRRFPFHASRWIVQQALGRELRRVLKELGLPEMTWYEATKHTFASHFVRDGGSLETLAIIMGQSSTQVTRRYAHLQSDQIRPEDTARAQVDFAPGELLTLRPVPAAQEGADWDGIGTDADRQEGRKAAKHNKS